MHFHFSAFNHSPSGKETLLDMFLWLQAGLEETGHTVSFSSDTLDPAAMNVLWECFIPPESGVELAASGLNYGIVVTEFMDGQGFNRGTPSSEYADRRDDTYRARWQGFEAAARSSKFFWSLAESNLAPLRQRAPASFLELGYSDRLLPTESEVPSIDFSFTGEVTPLRMQAIERLAAHAEVRWYRHLLPLDERDKLILATRIYLAPNKTLDWDIPSPTRVGKVLHYKRGIALDRTPQTTPQSRLVDVRPEGVDYVDYALSLLGSDWQRRAEQSFERFRAELPMKVITQRLLDECLLG